jgi:hypothetical protein
MKVREKHKKSADAGFLFSVNYYEIKYNMARISFIATYLFLHMYNTLFKNQFFKARY